MRIGLVLSPSFQAVCFGAVAAFDVANKQAGEKIYDVRAFSEDGGLVTSSAGMQVMTEPFDQAAFDTLIVAAGLDIPTSSPGLVRLLRAAARNARRVSSICLGSFVLGDAGLLNGRRATTHWRYAQEMQARFPGCNVDADKIFIADGQIWTSAGMSAGTDMVVGMIERDLGAERARSVAKGMVMYHSRPGGQSQHSVLLEVGTSEDRIQKALNYARQNLRESLHDRRFGPRRLSQPAAIHATLPLGDRHDAGQGRRSLAPRIREADAGADSFADRGRGARDRLCDP
ncbi:transcriptional regulator GlxA family with amidase domain [Bradyrhizobium sp. GM5.1]